MSFINIIANDTVMKNPFFCMLFIWNFENMTFHLKYDQMLCNIFHKNFVGHIKQTNFVGLICTHLP